MFCRKDGRNTYFCRRGKEHCYNGIIPDRIGIIYLGHFVETGMVLIFGSIAAIILVGSILFCVGGGLTIRKSKWLIISFCIDVISFVLLIIYLMYLIPNDNNLQTIVVSVLSAVLGGAITLSGVAWTINHSDKTRKEDLERIERERKEEEFQKAKPLFTFNIFDHVPSVKDGRKLCATIDDLHANCSVYAEIENSDKSSFEIKRLYHDKTWYDLNGNTVILPKSNVVFAFNFNEVFDIYFEVVDSLENSHYYEIKVVYIAKEKGDGKLFHTIKEIKEISQNILEVKGILETSKD